MLNCDIYYTIKKREFQTRSIDLKIHDISKFTSEISGALFDDSDNQIFHIDPHCIREYRYCIKHNNGGLILLQICKSYLIAWEF